MFSKRRDHLSFNAEGGAITTNSKKIYEKITTLRSHGMVKNELMEPWEYEMQDLGFNYRITDIQCALGIKQLEKLDYFIKKRISIAKKYDSTFRDSMIRPLYQYNGKSSYHLYVVQVDFNKTKISKSQLFKEMKKRNVGLQVHYIPINKQPYYQSLGYGSENTPNMDLYYD